MTNIPPGNKSEIEIGVEIYSQLEREINAAGGTACKRWMGEYTSPLLGDAAGIMLAAELVEACSWCPIVASCARKAATLPKSQRGCMVLGAQHFNNAGERVMHGPAAVAAGIQLDAEMPDGEQLYEVLADVEEAAA